MTIWFQIVLIFVSLATVTFILRGIRKSQVQINYPTILKLYDEIILTHVHIQFSYLVD